MDGSPPNLHTMVHRRARIQDVLKVNVTVKGDVIGHFCDFTKIASSRRQMAGSPPHLHRMVPSIARIKGVLTVKVKVKGHVIRTLLWCHEMFAIQYLLTFCLYMHSLYKAPLHSPSSKCQAARCNVYIMEWATPSLTVWLQFSMCHIAVNMVHKLQFCTFTMYNIIRTSILVKPGNCPWQLQFSS